MTKLKKSLFGVALLGLILAGAIITAGVRRVANETAQLFPQAAELSSVSAFAPAQEWMAAVERARAAVRAEMAEQDLPGVSVAVSAGGNLVWAEGFGFRDVVTRAPVTPETRFHIGTAAPMVTAAAGPSGLEGLGLKHTGTDAAAEWSPEHIGEPEEDPPPFRAIREAIFEPLGLADPPQPLPGERATLYVPRGAKDPRGGRRKMAMRDLACCAEGKALYSTPSDLVRLAAATKAEGVSGELAGGSVVSVVRRGDVVVAVASNVAHARTEALAQKVAEGFGK